MNTVATIKTQKRHEIDTYLVFYLHIPQTIRSRPRSRPKYLISYNVLAHSGISYIPFNRVPLIRFRSPSSCFWLGLVVLFYDTGNSSLVALSDWQIMYTVKEPYQNECTQDNFRTPRKTKLIENDESYEFNKPPRVSLQSERVFVLTVSPFDDRPPF